MLLFRSGQSDIKDWYSIAIKLYTIQLLIWPIKFYVILSAKATKKFTLVAHQHIIGYFSALQWCEYSDKIVEI